MAETITVKEAADDSVSPPIVKAGSAKSQRFDRCYSFMEVKIDPGLKSLKHLDSNKFKKEIKRWAKAVVKYARQVSDHFGSSRR